MILVSGDVRFMQIFAGVLWKLEALNDSRVVENSDFSVLSVDTSSESLEILATFSPKGRERCSPAHINAEADDDGKNHRYAEYHFFSLIAN